MKGKYQNTKFRVAYKNHNQNQRNINPILIIFSHVQQLLMNDELLEEYFILFGKHKDRIMTEIPANST